MKNTIQYDLLSNYNSRRLSLRAILLAGAVAFVGGIFPIAPTAGEAASLPDPPTSGIEHVVLVMMENRSFDHFLGWLPNAEGRQSGLSFLDRTNGTHPTFPLAPDFQGCRYNDPDHSYAGGRVEYNGGACDGWLRAGNNDVFSIGYYVKNDLPFIGQAAPAWTVCDQYYAPIMASTYPNRIIQHAAQTDRLDNSLAISSLPTIWDRLSDAGISARYYYTDVPMIALWGAKYLPIVRPITGFMADCTNGTLPGFSWVEPKFSSEELGTSGDDHPFSDIRNGEAFLNKVYNAVRNSPQWDSTVLVINFDEWGGFFDHVPPTLAPVPPGEQALGNDGRRGFRVPCLVISPWSRRGFVAKGVYDHTSVLKLIEWRWNLPALTVRDAGANNLAEVLDFSSKNVSTPAFTVPAGPFASVCTNKLAFTGTNGLSLTWPHASTLQTAPTVVGPWRNLTNALPPYPVATTNGFQFFRVNDEWSDLSSLAAFYGFFVY